MKRFALTSERLVLDSPVESDIDRIERYCQDSVFEKYLTVPWPYTRADAVFFVNMHVPKGWDSGDELTWAIRRSAGGPLLGVIGYRVSTANIGFWLGAEHRGAGIMTDAVTLVADRVFDDGRRDVRWECVVGNAASASVARKSGFAFTGTGPATIVGRDGTRPESWRGVLRSTDDRSVKPGWPA